MNFAVTGLLLARLNDQSPVISSKFRLLMAKSRFDRIVVPIARDCHVLTVANAQFSRILSSVIVQSSEVVYNNTFFRSPLRFYDEDCSTFITNCAFYNISNTDSAILMSTRTFLLKFNMSFCNFDKCISSGPDAASCIYLNEVNFAIDHVCCTNCDSSLNSFAYIIAYDYNTCFFNHSSIALCGPNNIFTSTFQVRNGSFCALNTSKCQLSKRYTESLSLLFKYNEFSMRYLRFCSSMADCQLSLDSLFATSNISDLIFVNNSGVNKKSSLILLYSVGEQIDRIFDLNNSGIPVRFESSVLERQFSINFYYTDRENISCQNVSFGSVISIGPNQLPDWGIGQLCATIVEPAATKAASQSKMNATVIWVTIIVVVSFAGFSALSWMCVVRIRYKRKISELTKTIDLDEALATIQ